MQVALLRRYCRPGDDVLDIGCGTGLIMERISRHVRSVSGVDLSAGMLSIARRKGFSVMRGDAGALPYRSEAFDVVYSFKVIAHLQRLESFIDEVQRVLRPGGTAILEFYNSRSLRRLRKRLFRGRVAPGVNETAVYTRYDSDRQIRDYFSGKLSFERQHGLVVLTPVAKAHDLPVIGSALRAAERASSRSPLHRFGGFLSAVLRKPMPSTDPAGSGR